MNMVVATTGYANLLTRWTSALRENVRARDITMLDLHAPEVLRDIWAELQEDHGPLKGTATIYHFGIDEQTGICRRITYRSKDNFESEIATEGGFGVKPVPVAVPTPTGLNLDDLVRFAEDIRVEQDAMSHRERIYIGGDLVLTFLSADGITARVIHRFSDQFDAWQAMNGASPLGITASLRGTTPDWLGG